MRGWCHSSQRPSPSPRRCRILGNTTWVKPKLVAEVKFTEWTSKGEMRHPVFLGLRADKKATDVVREEPKHDIH